MALHIEFSAHDATPRELDALAALIASLGGRLPAPAPFQPDLFAGPVTAAVHVPVADAPMPPPPEGVVVDSRGFPHDLRIHASTATKKADGSWTMKRGVEKELVQHVEAELRATMSAPLPPLADDAPVTTDPAAAFPTPDAPDAPPPPPPTDAVVPPPPVDNDGVVEFARVMRIVLAKQAAGTMTTEAVNAICAEIGLPDMRSLKNRPDLIAAFEALLP